MLCRGRFDPGHAVRQAGVAEVFPTDVVKSLGPLAGTHAVHLHHDETQFGNGVLACLAAELLRHEGALWSRVDLLDHRILLPPIEVRGTDDDAVDVSLAVACFADES